MEKKRLLSIDTLRGMDMLVIMGLSTLIFRICDLFPGGGDSWMAAQMRHVDWNGLAIMDMEAATSMAKVRVAAMAAKSTSATAAATRAVAAVTTATAW